MSKTELPELLIRSGKISPRKDRKDYLRKIFSSEWHFKHYATDMVYVPVTSAKDTKENFVFGRFGKRVLDRINEGPEKEFAFTQRESWRAANFILDVANHPDGQKVAAQVNGDVGKPLAILSSLIGKINQSSPDSGWYIDINPITEKRDFWEAAKQYEGQITRAEFTYVTPNVLGIRDKLNKRLKEYRENENAQTVSVTLTEPKGKLILNSDEVHDAVTYISQGGGKAKLKAGSKTIYDSTEIEKCIEIETEDSQHIMAPEGREHLRKRLFE